MSQLDKLMLVRCVICGKEFKRDISKIIYYGRNTYCGDVCKGIGRRKSGVRHRPITVRHKILAALVRVNGQACNICKLEAKSPRHLNLCTASDVEDIERLEGYYIACDRCAKRVVLKSEPGAPAHRYTMPERLGKGPRPTSENILGPVSLVDATLPEEDGGNLTDSS